jgi:hypothetical protein
VIQRIQTVFLILAVMLTATSYFTELFTRLADDPAGWILSSFIAATLFSAGISIWSVFLFKDRVKQAAWVSKAFTFQIIAIGAGVGVFFTSGPIGSALLSEFVGVFLLSGAGMVQFAARKAILKDEALVQSIDRIR